MTAEEKGIITLNSDRFAVWKPIVASVVLVLIVAVPGLVWGASDLAFLVSFWGSALGTALGGMAAVGFALWIWAKEASEVRRVRALAAARNVSDSVAEIWAIVQPTPRQDGSSPFTPLQDETWGRIEPHFRAAQQAASAIEDTPLRHALSHKLSYISCAANDRLALDAIADYRIRCVEALSAIKKTVEAFQSCKPLPSGLIARSEDFDEALAKAKNERQERLNSLLASVSDSSRP